MIKHSFKPLLRNMILGTIFQFMLHLLLYGKFILPFFIRAWSIQMLVCAVADAIVYYALNRLLKRRQMHFELPVHEYKMEDITLEFFAEKFLDGLYNSRLKPNEQCTGWYHLKKMVAESLEPTDENLIPFHPLLRVVLRRHWIAIKKLRIDFPDTLTEKIE